VPRSPPRPCRPHLIEQGFGAISNGRCDFRREPAILGWSSHVGPLRTIGATALGSSWSFKSSHSLLERGTGRSGAIPGGTALFHRTFTASSRSARVAIPLGGALLTALALPAILLHTGDSRILPPSAPVASKSRVVNVASEPRRTVTKPPVRKARPRVRRAAPAATHSASTPPSASTRAAAPVPHRAAAARVTHAKARHAQTKRAHVRHTAPVEQHAARQHAARQHAARQHAARQHAHQHAADHPRRARHAAKRTDHAPHPPAPNAHAHTPAEQHGKAKK